MQFGAHTQSLLARIGLNKVTVEALYTRAHSTVFSGSLMNLLNSQKTVGHLDLD